MRLEGSRVPKTGPFRGDRRVGVAVLDCSNGQVFGALISGVDDG